MSKPEKIHWPVVFSAAGRKDWPKPTIVDYFLHPAFGGNGLGAYGKQTLDEMRTEYPDAVILDEDGAFDAYNSAWKKPPKRITHDQWMYALEVLPPCRWRNSGGCETFHVSELVAGSVANIYCRIGSEYFELQDVFTLSQQEIAAKCIAFRDSTPQG